MCLTALIIIGIIALIIFLIMMIPVGADIGYADGQLSLSAKVMGIFLQLLPKTEEKDKKPTKEKKPKKEKKKKEEPPAEETGAEEEKEKKKKKLELDFTLDEIVALLKTVFKGLGKFRKMKVDRFLLHYIAAGKDPYKTAVTFGKINAALCALAPVCRERFHCPDTDVFTDITFAEEKPFIEFGLGFSIRIGQILSVVFTILFGALWILIKNKAWHISEKIKEKRRSKRRPKAALAETE